MNIRKLFLLGGVLLWIITMVACAKPPKVELSVSNTQIKQGDSVSVNWKSKDAKEVLLNGSKVSTAGTQTFQPSQTTQYELLGKSGKKEARDAKTVTVEVLPAGPTITLSANPGAINPGDKAQLNWNSDRAEKVEIAGIGTFGPSGSVDVNPNASTTYTAVAKGRGGDASASARITVTDKVADNTNNNNNNPTGFIPEVEGDFRGKVKSIFFDFDKSELRTDAIATLDDNARYLLENKNTTIVFRVEGNCDPRGSEEYNLALGDKRANIAKSYLISKGIDPSRMDVISNGKRNARGTEEGATNAPPSWANDRRGEFMYLRGGTATTRKPAPAQ